MRLRLLFFIVVLVPAALAVEGRAQAQAASCPTITVESKIENSPMGMISDFACPGAPITFTANVSGVEPKQEYTFRWTVSVGKIVKGQGTSSITVSTDTEDAVGALVAATVELVGLSGFKSDCKESAQASVGVAICCLPPCPTISIQCPTDLPQMGSPMTVSVNVSGGDRNAEARYKWEVSAGTIIAGQGTPMITVDTSGLGGNNAVTATVEVDGFPPECDRKQSCTVIFESYMPPPRKFDSYGDISSANEDERLAQFAEALRGEPGALGYIFYYGPRGVYERLSRALEFLKSQPGLDPGRIIAVKRSLSEKFEVELWIRPTGAPEPQPEPRH
jgi:hypothetical protein